MKIQRKYMAHYLNAHFASDSTDKDDYIRLGKDLEEYSPELSANVEKKSNILGQTSVTIDSYQKQGAGLVGQTLCRVQVAHGKCARRTSCAAACTPDVPACAAASASAPGRIAQAGEVPGQGNAAPCARQAGTPPAQREPPSIPAIAGSDRPHGR